MIKLRNVCFSYDKEIFKNINLDIPKNKVTFIIGSNGAGKSTLANIIGGLVFPSSGETYIDDILVNKKTDNKLIRKKVGMVFQNPTNQILFTKVYDDIKFTLENMMTEKEKIHSIIKNSLSKVEMDDYINSNPYNLSGGQKRRVAIASALSLNPSYLILDEATSMLDCSGKENIYKLFKKLKKDMGIIFITNNMNELIYADNVIILDDLNVYKYKIEDIVNDNDILVRHNLKIPFILKLANKLKIDNINDINEEFILKKACMKWYIF